MAAIFVIPLIEIIVLSILVRGIAKSVQDEEEVKKTKKSVDEIID